MSLEVQEPRPPHPVAFDVEYPERLSRLTTFFRIILAIPQLIVVSLLITVLQILTVLAWFAILFTARYPKAFFEFGQGVLRWSANVSAYLALLRDEYPPFSTEPGEYPVTLAFDRAERQSRFRLFIRWFAIIPNLIVFYFVQLASFVTTVIAWFAILFTARYPRGLHRFNVGVLRWQQRQQAYLYLLRDEYPPYSVNTDARPGNEVLSAIIGGPLFVLVMAATVLPFAGMLRDEDETVLVNVSLSSPGAIAREEPTGEANGIRVTLLDYHDPVPPPNDIDEEKLREGRYVAFDIEIEKEDNWPAVVSGLFTSLEDCSGETRGIEDVSGGVDFNIFWTDGGSDSGTVWFWLPEDEDACAFTYYAGLGSIRFRFEPQRPPPASGGSHPF